MTLALCEIVATITVRASLPGQRPGDRQVIACNHRKVTSPVTLQACLRRDEGASLSPRSGHCPCGGGQMASN